MNLVSVYECNYKLGVGGLHAICVCETVLCTSLVPRTSTPPGFDRLQYAKSRGREKAWEIHHMICGQPSYVITPRANSQVMYETDLTSYEDGTSTSRELHQAYETYPG